MATKQRYQTDAVIPPGVYLQEVLEDFGMTQADLARRIGRPAQVVNEIIGGRKAITASTAIELEQVLGVPAYMWNELEAAYQLAKARQAELAEDLTEDLALLAEFEFYGELVKRQSVTQTRDKKVKILELRHFFGVTALSNVKELYQPAFRLAASSKPAASPFALAAWLREGEIRASQEQVHPLDLGRLRILMAGLRKLTIRPLGEVLPKVKSELAQVGVAFIAQKSLPGTRACGAAFWWRRKKPVVLVSDFGKSEDRFWFSLLHELAHIALHGSARMFVSLDELGDPWSTAQMEAEADQLASGMLIPDEIYSSFHWKWNFPTDEEIIAFARQAGVHAGIVAGRLCKDKIIGWQRMRNLMRTFEL
jgi:HTH-type transcriptional regulator / antitoxin HigA